MFRCPWLEFGAVRRVSQGEQGDVRCSHMEESVSKQSAIKACEGSGVATLTRLLLVATKSVLYFRPPFYGMFTDLKLAR